MWLTWALAVEHRKENPELKTIPDYWCTAFWTAGAILVKSGKFAPTYHSDVFAIPAIRTPRLQSQLTPLL